MPGPCATGCFRRRRRYASEPPSAIDEPVDVALELVDLAGVGAAQPHGVADDRLEHGLELEGERPIASRTWLVAVCCSVAVGEIPRQPLDLSVER